MKAFDLAAAKNGAAVVTRDGHEARIVCFDSKWNGKNRLVALIKTDDGDEMVNVMNEDGAHCYDSESSVDLFMKTTYHEGFTNIYRFTDGKVGCIWIYQSKEAAKQHISQSDDCIYITTIKVSWEE